MGKRILVEGHTCGPLRSLQRAFVLVDGENYYRTFVEAAEKAESYILMAGWQFDSEVLLLRGNEAGGGKRDYRLLPFLESLCRRKPDLRIYILAWDYTSLFGFDREWFQDLLFSWRTEEKIQFEYDDAHPVGASHHQKLVCIDGSVAFIGGMDICSSRWDDRHHLNENPKRRNTDGKPYEPYHDIQACVTGEIADEAARVFAERWKTCTGEDLELPSPSPRATEFAPPGCIEIEAAAAALSRTMGKMLRPKNEPVREIERLYEKAILSAESLVYMENQYFSSRLVFQALCKRMRDDERPPLQLILILPREPHAAMEKVALGQTQAKMIRLLRETRKAHGHQVGIYFTRSEGGGREDWATYIHAKLLLIDDRFLSVGSANTSNRSMGLDTELNVSLEMAEDGATFNESLTELRVSLLREHTGVSADEAESFRDPDTVGATLARLAGTGRWRLCNYSTEEIEGVDWVRKYLPEMPLDPDRALVEEEVFETIGADAGDMFSAGILGLQRIILTGTKSGKVALLTKFLIRRWRMLLTVVVLCAVLLLIKAYLY